jgi:hypothetical protein
MKKCSLVAASFSDYAIPMSTVSEIQAVLPRLTNEELRAVGVALRDQFHARKMGIIYEDSYGLWTAEDQASVAAEAFALMDPEEKRHGDS